MIAKRHRRGSVKVIRCQANVDYLAKEWHGQYTPYQEDQQRQHQRCKEVVAAEVVGEYYMHEAERSPGVLDCDGDCDSHDCAQVEEQHILPPERAWRAIYIEHVNDKGKEREHGE